MLREIVKVRQIPGEAHRRWFTDERMDLFVWCAEHEPFGSYQLSYDKTTNEKAITYKPCSGYLHTGVDDGVRPGQYPATPLLVADGFFDAPRVRDEFLRRAQGLDERLVSFVDRSLQNYVEESQQQVMRENAGADSDKHRASRLRWFWCGLGSSTVVLIAWLLTG